MNVNSLAKLLGDSTYGFLAINLLFGLFCAIIVWRRLRELRFRNEDEQQQFLNELNETLNAGDFDSAIEACELDPRALPQLTRIVLMNRELDQDDLRQVVGERFSSATFWARWKTGSTGSSPWSAMAPSWAYSARCWA